MEAIKQPWYNQALDKIVWFGSELIKTFSNEKSFFASKRIERGVLFINACVLLDYWFFTHADKIEAIEAVEIFGAQMFYAGFTMLQGMKEKKLKADETK